jgi:hypothetical protein
VRSLGVRDGRRRGSFSGARVVWCRALVCALVAACSVAPRLQVAAQAPGEARGDAGRAPRWLARFIQALAPHGTFTVVDPVGLVWAPAPEAVGSAFVPYVTHGLWEPSPNGWQFVSEFVWGDLVFHYGRWFDDPEAGWVWAPDDAWGASWVDWRNDGTVVAWSPRLPEALRGTAVEARRRWFTAPASAPSDAPPPALPVGSAGATRHPFAVPCPAWPIVGGQPLGARAEEVQRPDPPTAGVAPGRRQGAPTRGRLLARGTVDVRVPPSAPATDVRAAERGAVDVRAPEPTAAPLVLRARDDRQAVDASRAGMPQHAEAGAPFPVPVAPGSVGPSSPASAGVVHSTATSNTGSSLALPHGSWLWFPVPVRPLGPAPAVVTPAAPWIDPPTTPGFPGPVPGTPAARAAPCTPTMGLAPQGSSQPQSGGAIVSATLGSSVPPPQPPAATAPSVPPVPYLRARSFGPEPRSSGDAPATRPALLGAPAPRSLGGLR